METTAKSLLQRALLANAIFSALTGTALLALGGPLAPALGVSSPWVLRVVGALLLPFALDVFQLARRTPIPAQRVRAVIGMDVAWVIGSVVLLAFDLVSWTAAGMAVVGTVAAVVGVFAVLQGLGLRQAGAGARAQPTSA